MSRTAVITSLLVLWLSLPAAAQAVLVRWAGADGKVVEQRELTLRDLDALPQAAIETSTPWTEGVRRFTGPPLSAIATLGGLWILQMLHFTNDHMRAVDFKRMMFP